MFVLKINTRLYLKYKLLYLGRLWCCSLCLLFYDMFPYEVNSDRKNKTYLKE